MSDWSLQRIEGLAPDSAAIKAAQGTAKPSKWKSLGRDDRMIWGECQGSGANPYQVRVHLIDVAYKCTCPSRKLPCKHTLALLLMMVGGVSIPASSPPGFVEEWSANRAKRSAAKQDKESPTEVVPDPEARSKRIEKREGRIGSGLDQLEVWIADIIASGLAATRSQGQAFWSQMASRLIDAQAPGLAKRVREIGDVAVSSPQWQSEMMMHLARLQLLVDAYRNIDRLPADLAAEVRTRVGWTQEHDMVKQGNAIRDLWVVLGQHQTQEDQIRTQVTWLHGEQSRRFALTLDFSAGLQPLPAGLTVGQVIEAEFVFFKGCVQLRALERARHATASSRASLPSPTTIEAMQKEHARLLALNPWLDRYPVVLGPLRPHIEGGRFLLQDEESRRINVRRGFRHQWSLLALAGNGHFNVFGEWDGTSLELFTVECAGQLFTISTLGDLPVLSQVA